MNDRTCYRCNLPLTRSQKKYCSHLCANRDTMEAKSAASKARPHANCSVGGCDKPARSRTAELCKMHYHRLYRYGTLELRTIAGDIGKPVSKASSLMGGDRIPSRTPIDIVGQRFGSLVVLHRVPGAWLCGCDCGNQRTVSAGDLNRYGDSSTCGTKANHLAPVVDYSGAHDRVRRTRGAASTLHCVDCGHQAQHWSYDHADPDEMVSPTLEAAYSLDINHYEPRCVPCHKRFDLDRINGTPRQAMFF